MEDKKKNSYDIFFRVLFVLFVIFLCLYAISISGFVDTRNSKKTLYTEEQIKKFENDVKNGEYVDITDYLVTEDIDYSNGFSRFGEDVSNTISSVTHYTFKFFEEFFDFMFK